MPLTLFPRQNGPAWTANLRIGDRSNFLYHLGKNSTAEYISAHLPHSIVAPLAETLSCP
jgi:hypothetical protein